MGLFADIIRDAHRPLNGQWVRRNAVSEPEHPEFDEETAPENNGGMQTVFRFQKAEPQVKSGGFQEASYRQGKTFIPAGDPLTAGSEVKSPRANAYDVGITDITVTNVSGESELETGQEESASPSKIEAASMASDSYAVQSFNTSGLVETDLTHVKHQSEIPEGSRQPVSRQSEAFESRLPGRGAPSETSSLPPAYAERPSSRPFSTADPKLERRLAPDNQTASTAQYSRASAADTPGSPAKGEFPAAFSEFVRTDIQGHLSQSAERQHDFTGNPFSQRSTEGRRAEIAPESSRYRSSPAHSNFAPAPIGNKQTDTPESPSLVIGRIDVTVIAAAKPDTQAATHSDDSRSFLSRNYLKRV